jgi:type VI secretion system secreted protein Hcp
VTLDALGFDQQFTNSGTVQLGGGAGAGKPDVGDLSVKVPLSPKVVSLLSSVAKGTHLDKVSVEMCKPTEVSGHCLLQVDLQSVLITGIDSAESADDAADAVATLSFNSSQEKVTTPGRGGVSYSVTYNIAEATSSSTGGALPRPVGDTKYLTTLSDGFDDAIDTTTWGHSATQSGTTYTGAGGGAGKASFRPVKAATRTGGGTVKLLSALVAGKHFSQVDVTGCAAAPCTQKLSLGEVLVTGVTLGSPSLTDQVLFDYATIKWDRTESGDTGSFSWNVAANSPNF